jgi:hypothetical protein
MKKIRMHMTTSTIGVMFGPTWAIFFIPFCLPTALMIAPRNPRRFPDVSLTARYSTTKTLRHHEIPGKLTNQSSVLM